MVTHVLDTPGDGHVACAECYFTRCRGDGAHPSGTHAVYRETGSGLRQTRENDGSPPKGQSLVFFLTKDPPSVFLNHFRLHERVAPKKLANNLHHHVVGSGIPENALFSGLAKSGPYCVNQNDFSCFHI